MPKDKEFFWLRNAPVTNVLGRVTTNTLEFQNGKCKIRIRKTVVNIQTSLQEEVCFYQFTGKLFRYICCELTESNKKGFEIPIKDCYKNLGMEGNITRAKNRLKNNLEILKSITIDFIDPKKEFVCTGIIENYSLLPSSLKIQVPYRLYQYLKIANKDKKNMLQYPKELLKLECNNNRNKYVFGIYDKLLEHFKLNKNRRRNLDGVKISVKTLLNVCRYAGMQPPKMLRDQDIKHKSRYIREPLEKALEFIKNEMNSGLEWKYNVEINDFKDFINANIIYKLKEFS